jgi:hypothetical protein
MVKFLSENLAPVPCVELSAIGKLLVPLHRWKIYIVLLVYHGENIRLDAGGAITQGEPSCLFLGDTRSLALSHLHFLLYPFIGNINIQLLLYRFNLGILTDISDEHIVVEIASDRGSLSHLGDTALFSVVLELLQIDILVFDHPVDLFPLLHQH